MKKSIKTLIVIAAVASFAFINPKSETRQINVVIDAGHGGKDFGATHEDVTEKQIVEAITNKIKAQNDHKNVVLHITRMSDEFKTLSERTDFINKVKPDLVLSLHVNAGQNAQQSGVEIYIGKNNANHEKSNTFALKLSDKLAKNHNLKVTKIEKAPYFILNKSEAPALMVELGFLSNASDRDYLTDDAAQSRIANTILEFITEIE